MSNVRNWIFTVNNPTGVLPENPKVRYCVWQLETGANGTPHWQGYVELTTNVRLGGMKKWLPTAHFEPRRGTREQARAYSMKEDTRVDGPWEIGSWESGGQGKRTDLATACDIIKEGGGMKRVAEECPMVFAKFHRGLRELERELATLPDDSAFIPRPWQQKIIDIVSQPADDRKIIWVCDVDGNKGKSRLAQHLVCEYDAIVLGGKMADMSYMYDKEPIVVFDVSRTQAEHSDHLYSFAEKLKDGLIVSTKYESCMKVFKPPHVIFFSNSPCESWKWSADRLVEINL